jgi:hypothetical protein
MFTNKDIIDIEIDDVTYTAIVFDNKNTDLPAALLAGEKEASYLYKNEELIPWYWKSFSTYNNAKCLYFDKIEIFPLAELSMSLRSKAPLLINNLSKALNKCSTKFLDLRGGIISAWRIYFTSDNDVLILSSSLGDIFASTNSEATRFNNTSSLIHSAIHPAFSLIDEMAQLYYYAALGIKPFEKDTIREIGYKAIPLEMISPILAPEIDKDTSEKIDGILHLSMGKQREISGNLSPQAALEWFFKRFEDVDWKLPDRDTLPNVYKILEDNSDSKSFLENIESKAKKRIFWRKRGTLIIVIAICSLFVGAFIKDRVETYLAPPYTAGMDQEGVIQSYYQAQNDLDVEKLEDSLAHGFKSPISNEVTTLFVTRQTRQAYESKNTVINPVTWEKEGRQPIPSGSMIYGVDDVKIQSIGNNIFKVTSTFYSPDDYAEFEEDSNLSSEIVVNDYDYTYRFEQVQLFTVELAKKGWYEITDIQTLSVQYLDTLTVPTIIEASNMLIGEDTATVINTDEEDKRTTTSFVDPRLVELSKQAQDASIN